MLLLFLSYVFNFLDLDWFAFFRQPQPPPATVTMVAGGGALVICVEMLFRSCANGLRPWLSLKLVKS